MMKSNQYPEESPPGYYTGGTTCLAGDAHRHIEAHARAAGPKARVRVEVAVRVVETCGADVLQPDGASIHADASCAARCRTTAQHTGRARGT